MLIYTTTPSSLIILKSIVAPGSAVPLIISGVSVGSCIIGSIVTNVVVTIVNCCVADTPFTVAVTVYVPSGIGEESGTSTIHLPFDTVVVPDQALPMLTDTVEPSTAFVFPRIVGLLSFIVTDEPLSMVIDNAVEGTW